MTQSYQEIYEFSLINPESFWDHQAQNYVSWFKPYDEIRSGNFSQGENHWFQGGQLNACFNALDRHLSTRSEQLALIWEGNDPGTSKTFTYGQLHEEVNRFSNVLKKLGVHKGERVCIYMPMIPEALMAMLACSRIGAIHSVVFAGFSAQALKSRIQDAACRIVITADGAYRGEKSIQLKSQVDDAVLDVSEISSVLVIQHTGQKITMRSGRDVWYHELASQLTTFVEPEVMQASDPLFILYTSGSTGKPKGIVHATGGYLVYAAMTFDEVFDHQENDRYWCTADLGWITGHTYCVYGPLLNGATLIMYEGVPNYPTYERYWQIIDKHQVSIFYTSPTAIRAIRREGDALLQTTHRQSLRILGSVGEPLNPEVWSWYHEKVGLNRCKIVDTWWQTETGGIALSCLPRFNASHPHTVGWPMFGIQAEVVDEQGQTVPDETQGYLVIRQSWPGIMLGIYGDPKRMLDLYFKTVPGCYLTGDAAIRHHDGQFTIIGRTDDVIKVSGHRIGTGEIEDALLSHPQVAEAAAVGVPDPITGEAIASFVVLKPEYSGHIELKQSLVAHVRQVLGPIATLQSIYWVEALPKTRSGKIMRRLLRKLLSGDESLGDLSTLAEPQVMDKIKTQLKPSCPLS
jgi:acetyl-CoA synthetase